VLFETAIAESSWTIPSHATLLTGVCSRVHGMELAYSRLSPSRRTVAETFRENGYRTAGVFSGPFLHPIFGFGRGFDSYVNAIEQPPEPAPPIEALSDREGIDLVLARYAVAHRSLTSAAVTDRAFDFLADVGSEPFFLFLYYFDPHYDYAPPEELWRRFDPDFEGRFTGEDFIRNPDIGVGMDPRNLRNLVARYDGEILYTDSQIGRLLDALETNGLRDRTLVVVTGDHGEEFLEHGNRGHRHSLFDEVLRVPLIASLPGRMPEGRRVAAVVRHLDVARTILSAAGITPGEELGGVDLRRLLGSGAKPAPLVAESRLIRKQVENEWVSLRSADIKYLRRRQGEKTTELLFDLGLDPEELRPLIRQTTVVADAEAWRAFGRARLDLARLLESSPPSADTRIESGERELPAELEESLRALGYVQ